jgi:hypothetical protein
MFSPVPLFSQPQNLTNNAQSADITIKINVGTANALIKSKQHAAL